MFRDSISTNKRDIYKTSKSLGFLERSKKIIAAVLCFCVICFFSCSYSDGSFIYDNKASWNSSYSDIINIYGEPYQTDKTSDNPAYTVAVYENVSVAGYDGFTRGFVFAEPNEKLNMIALELKTNGVLAILWAEPVYNALAEKYGNPVSFEDSEDLFTGGQAVWELSDTYIKMAWGCPSTSDIEEGLIQIMYASKEALNQPTPTPFVKSTDGI